LTAEKGFIMNTDIVGRHVNLTNEIKDYINSTIEDFGKYNLDIISVHSIVSAEDKHGKPQITFEFVMNIANKDTIVIKQKHQDLHTAVDIASDRMSKILRRHKDKIHAHNAEKLGEIFQNKIQDAIANEMLKMENEIVPMRLDSYKPIDIQEALDNLKASKENFVAFYDKDDNFRVMYKMENNKFGLY
jgi:putative sigma-54 modulation protein